jgi:glutamyl-tRNA reductase
VLLLVQCPAVSCAPNHVPLNTCVSLLLLLLQVGFIGLGKMGSRMVTHLLDAGTNVVAFDHNR